MIVSAALVPHSPLLLPTVGAEARENLAQTLSGLARLISSLREQSPDTVVLIKTPEHGRKRRTVFQLQVPQRYAVDVSQFGDLITKDEFSCDTVLGGELKNNFRDSSITLAYTSETALEYTASIPLMTLFRGTSVKVLVLQPPNTDFDTLYSFGARLTSTLQRPTKRIACLAAGDCAHCIKKGKKEGYEHVCLPFDYMFLDALQKKSPNALRAIKREDVVRLNACAVSPSLVLRGMLDSLSWTARPLSYEAPFGVGYAVVEFLL